jgi:hypothetical protein
MKTFRVTEDSLLRRHRRFNSCVSSKRRHAAEAMELSEVVAVVVEADDR